MRAALIETEAPDGRHAWLCTGDDAVVVFSKFMQTQDLYCLVRMGRMLDDDQTQVDVLEALLDAWDEDELSMPDIEAINIKLADGSIRCIGTAKTDAEIEALAMAHPEAQRL